MSADAAVSAENACINSMDRGAAAAAEQAKSTLVKEVADISAESTTRIVKN